MDLLSFDMVHDPICYYLREYIINQQEIKSQILFCFYYMSKRLEQTFSESPQALKYRTRQFSTADKYSNLKLTAEELQQLYLENEKLKDCLATFGVTSEFQINEITTDRRIRMHSTQVVSTGNQMLAWSLNQKNEYLQRKVEKLKIEKEKQGKAIEKIKSSSKWKSRSECNPIGCYKDKYIKLLRIKCPDTEY